MAQFSGYNNILFTRQLFYETATPSDRQLVLYTLKDNDYEGYPSLKRLYLEMEDQTEYLFATTYFASWNHWKKLLQAEWFRQVIKECREELSLKLGARNLIELRKKAEEGHVQANQYLLEQKWNSSVGRPSKKKIEEEASKMVADNSDIQADYERLTGEAQRA